MQNAGSLRKKQPRHLSKPKAHNSENFPPNLSKFQELLKYLNIGPFSFSRPYLLSYATVFKLRLIIYLGRSVFLLPWKWKQTSNNLEILSLSKFWVFVFRIFSCVIFTFSSILICFYFHLLLQMLALDHSSKGSYRLVFKCWVAVCWHLHSAMLTALVSFYGENMRHYINTLVAANKDFLRKYGDGNSSNSEEDSEGGLFLNVTIPMLFIQIVTSFLRYIFLYDTPIYLSTHLRARETLPPNLVIGFGILQDFWTGGQLVSGTLLIGWILVTHSSSLKHWLEEGVHDEEPPIRRDSSNDEFPQPSSDPLEAFLLYRSLQILSRVFNESVSDVSVSMCAFMNWSAAIGCGYLAVRSANHIFLDEFPESLFYPIGTILMICSSFSQFQAAAKMNDMSGSFLDSWSRFGDLRMRKSFLSCQMMELKALRLTSVTRGSLVTYLKTLSDHIIDCIISFN